MIFHIASIQDWQRAQAEGEYTADTLQTEGFIHCSAPEQVLGTANRFYHHRSDLMLLFIDEAGLDDPVIYENLEGGSDLFPHVYGPIPLTAIREAVAFPSLPSGDFLFPTGE